MQIKEIIVVEGRDDTAKIRQAVNADTIETNGSAISGTTLTYIRHAKEKRGVIIFTDPDYPGERIRHIIDQNIPGCKHAFLTREEAKSKRAHHRSLGIEHASITAIQQALSQVYELQATLKSDITKAELMKHGLIGGPHASTRRERLGKLLKIGHTNGKQLLKRLTMFQITKNQFIQAVSQIQQEEANDI